MRPRPATCTSPSPTDRTRRSAGQSDERTDRGSVRSLIAGSVARCCDERADRGVGPLAVTPAGSAVGHDDVLSDCAGPALLRVSVNVTTLPVVDRLGAHGFGQCVCPPSSWYRCLHRSLALLVDLIELVGFAALCCGLVVELASLRRARRSSQGLACVLRCGRSCSRVVSPIFPAGVDVVCRVGCSVDSAPL